MARITHPTVTAGRHYGHFGVVFDNGAADVELTDQSRAWYAGRGYGIEDGLGFLADWTKAKLVAHAAEQRIELGGAKTKAEILAAIDAQALPAIVEPAE